MAREWMLTGGTVLAGLWLLGAARLRRTRNHDGEGPALSELDDRTALARVIRSEAGSQTWAERAAVAWVVRNRARREGVGIAALVCTPRCGPQGRGRPFSSRRPPREEDQVLADAVLAAPRSSDPTGGATSAFEPELQDRLAWEGRPGHRPAAEVRARWLRHADVYGRVGRWEFYGPKRPRVAQSTANALSALRTTR